MKRPSSHPPIAPRHAVRARELRGSGIQSAVDIHLLMHTRPVHTVMARAARAAPCLAMPPPAGLSYAQSTSVSASRGKNRPLLVELHSTLQSVGVEGRDECHRLHPEEVDRKSPEVIIRDYALARAGTGAAAAAPVSLRNTVRIKANPIIASQNKWVLCKCIA